MKNLLVIAFLLVAGSCFAQSYVPYTGATTDVNIGGNNYYGQYLFLGRLGSGTGGNVRFVGDNGTAKWLTGLVGYASARNYEIYSLTRNSIDLSIDSATGNLGVGSGSPTYKLTFGTPSDKIGWYSDATHYNNIEFYNGSTGGMYFDQSTGSGGGYHFAVAGSEKIVFDYTGKVGIGTTSPQALLDVAGVGIVRSYFQVGGTGAEQGFLTYNAGSAANTFNVLGANGKNLALGAGGRYEDLFIKASGGNVGIGTVNPTEKLSVNGNIRTKKVIVTQTGWADFVFEPGYKLWKLEDLDAFIKQHGHLPDVPSEKEIKKNGADVGATQALLLQKVEELTLYMIEQNKINKEQGKIIMAQQEKIRLLEAKMAKMSKRKN